MSKENIDILQYPLPCQNHRQFRQWCGRGVVGPQTSRSTTPDSYTGQLSGNVRPTSLLYPYPNCLQWARSLILAKMAPTGKSGIPDWRSQWEMKKRKKEQKVTQELQNAEWKKWLVVRLVRLLNSLLMWYFSVGNGALKIIAHNGDKSRKKNQIDWNLSILIVFSLDMDIYVGCLLVGVPWCSFSNT